MMTTTTAPTRTAEAVARDWAAAWNSADPSRLGALFSADATYTDLAIDQVFVGPTAISAFKAGSDALIADLHLEVLNAFGDGDQVAIESLYSGHFRGAPHPFAVRGTTTVRLRDDRITADTDNYSVATLLAQSGLPAGWTPSGN